MRPSASGCRCAATGGKYVDDDAMWAKAGQCCATRWTAPVSLCRGARRGRVLRAEDRHSGRDPAGREQTLSTVQVDFDQPDRFGLAYVDADGGRQLPVMVHRSMVGSMERLFAHLIEVHAGAFPPWYAPVQLEVLPVGDDQEEAASAPARAAIDGGPAGRGRQGARWAPRIRRARARRCRTWR